VPIKVQLPPKIAPKASGIINLDGAIRARLAKPKTTGTNIAVVVEGEMLLLEDVSKGSMRTEKRKWALAAFGLFLALSLSKIVTGFEVPLAVAVLLGVLLLLATKTVRYSELYSLIDFRLLVLIACMMSFGIAMEKTGKSFLRGQNAGHYQPNNKNNADNVNGQFFAGKKGERDEQ
jgi:hypothetical protein